MYPGEQKLWRDLIAFQYKKMEPNNKKKMKKEFLPRPVVTGQVQWV